MVAFAAALSLFAERQPYERYQSIVDRQMFGAPPPGFDPTKPPSEVSKTEAREAEAQLTKEQEQIRSAIHFSVINVTPGGETAVGFTDNGDPKNPIHYYLKVGEQRNGWLVKEADPVKATMTIAKGDVEVSLSIGGNSAKGGAVAKATTTAAPAAATTAATASQGIPRQGVSGARPAAAAGNTTQLNSLRSRRLLREQQRQQEAAEREAAQAEAEERRREDEARREEERLQREAEREEQRAQLQLIKEELRKAREEREAASQDQAPPPPPDMEDGPPPDFE